MAKQALLTIMYAGRGAPPTPLVARSPPTLLTRMRAASGAPPPWPACCPPPRLRSAHAAAPAGSRGAATDDPVQRGGHGRWVTTGGGEGQQVAGALQPMILHIVYMADSEGGRRATAAGGQSETNVPLPLSPSPCTFSALILSCSVRRMREASSVKPVHPRHTPSPPSSCPAPCAGSPGWPSTGPGGWPSCAPGPAGT